MKAIIEQHWTQIEALSENETEYDQEEAENLMNNAPSPKQRLYCYWNPEYEARRQARKRLWSPPLTPDPDEPWRPSHSLQPSQRRPSPPPSHHQQRSSPHPPLLQTSPQTSDQFWLRLPSKAQSKVRKAKKAAILRRSSTRSRNSSKLVSLHDRKGHVLVWSGKGRSRITSFEEYISSLSQGTV
ncbi:MAG: hypothetical protein Q9163_005573 [Psora crenata]